MEQFTFAFRPHVFLESRQIVKNYSFIADEEHFQLFEPKSMQYFLNAGEDNYNILFVGPTGAGKSNLVNVLFNRKVVRSEPSFNGVTDEIVMFKCKGQVFDHRSQTLQLNLQSETLALSITQPA